MNDTYFAMRNLPFRYTVNTYRGCQHNCSYCYGPYSHRYIGHSTEDFGKIILAKRNAPEVLDDELAKRTTRSIVILGSISDAYQPYERTLGITRKVLRVLSKHDWPCYIETKSDLVLRDIDIIGQMGKKGLCNVGTSVTVIDPDTKILLEPFSPSPKERLAMIAKISNTGAETCVHITPFIPYLTSDCLEDIIRESARAGAKYVIVSPLELSPSIWGSFKRSLERGGLTRVVRKLGDLYFKGKRVKGGRLTPPRWYHMRLEEQSHRLCKKHRIGFWPTILFDLHTANIGGAYRWRYPYAYDYWKLIKSRIGRKVSLGEALEVAGKFNVDNKYVRSLARFWVSGRLLEDANEISVTISDDRAFYRYEPG